MASPTAGVFVFVLISFLFLICAVRLSSAQSREDGEDFSVKSDQLQVTFFGNGSSDFRVDFLRDNATTGVYLIWRYTGLTETAIGSCPPFDKKCDNIGKPTPVLVGDFADAIAAIEKSLEPNFEKITQTANITVVDPDGTILMRQQASDVAASTSTSFEATNYLLLKDFTFPPLIEGQEPVTISKGGLKFNYAIRNWPFSPKATGLLQSISVEVYPQSSLVIEGRYKDDIPINTTLFTIVHPDGNQTWTLRLATECISDGTRVKTIETAAAINTQTQDLDVYLVFPISEDIYYDPDIQSLFGDSPSTSEGGSTNSGGGDGDNHDALIIATTVIIPIAAVVVLVGLIAVIALAVWRIVHRQRRIRALTNSEIAL